LSRQYWAVNAVLALILSLTSCQTSFQRSELSNDYYNIGNAYSDLEKYEKAAEFYKRALELNPDLNQATFNLARTNLEIGNEKSSLKLLEELERLDNQNLMVLEMMGYAWFKLDDHEKAMEYYKKCLSIDDSHVRSLYNLCILEMENENWAQSQDYLDRLLTLDDKQEYRALRAELAVAQGENDLAIGYYEDLVLEYGGDIKTYEALKTLYLETEKYYKALDMLDLLVGKETDENLKKNLYFEKCQIEIQTLDDVILGQTDLKNALEAGFADREKLDELVSSVDDLYKADLEKIIRDNIIITDTTSPTDNSALDEESTNDTSTENNKEVSAP